MQMKKILSMLLLICSMIAISGTARAQSASSILQAAEKKAAAENKHVLVIFHASWCYWCHKMDTAMNDPVCKDYFQKNYVITHLTVAENDTIKHPNTPGAQELMDRFYGAGLGIPYWLIFDKDGNMVADSKIRTPDQAEAQGDNIGCPASEAEVDAFIVKLKKTSVLSNDQAEAIRKRFRQNEH